MWLRWQSSMHPFLQLLLILMLRIDVVMLRSFMVNLLDSTSLMVGMLLVNKALGLMNIDFIINVNMKEHGGDVHEVDGKWVQCEVSW
jgi:hypothetical protein